MSDVVVLPGEVLNILLVLGVLGLISMFLLKLYNLLHVCEFYSLQLSIILLALGTICYTFIEISILITLGNTSSTDSTLIEYNIYNWFSRIFIILLWIFWVAELFFYATKQITMDNNQLERMSKRRSERINRYY